MTNPEPHSTPEQNNSREHYPAIEDWEAIQGGKPTFWLNAKENNIMVVHIYEDFDKSSGRQISTPLEGSSGGSLYQRIPKGMRSEGSVETRDGRRVFFPAFALISEHGDPCLDSSSEYFTQKDADDRFIKDEFDDYENMLAAEGWTKLHLVPNTNSRHPTFAFLNK